MAYNQWEIVIDPLRKVKGISVNESFYKHIFNMIYYFSLILIILLLTFGNTFLCLLLITLNKLSLIISQNLVKQLFENVVRF